MTSEAASHFQVLDGFPADVVAVAAQGFLQHEDYTEVLTPLIDRTVKAEGKVKFLYILGKDFAGVSPLAAFDDVRLGLTHLGDFARFGVVTDEGWIRMGVQMFAPMIPCPVRTFAMDQLDQAKEWITQDGEEKDPAAPEVAADSTLPI